ncbi:calcium/sodium antiporter [Haloferula sargassicola]|uniref:Sodium/calcium exchanger membrane region domain-containing protein n=1 Tax=Haloferula sargassicola TaxID=490096 RepID=A0ABP9UJY1_9BACT
MLSAALLTLLSFGLLFLGAEWLVRGGAGIALRLGLTALVVGLTVVAYGTSSPELLVSVKAAWAGQPGISVGNVIGSNIFNIAVILGVASLIRPIRVQSSVIRRDAPVMLAVTLGGLAVLWDGAVSRLEGGLLLVASVVYTVWIIRAARKEAPGEDEGLKPLGVGRALFFILGGLLVLAAGSRLLVDNSIIIARALGVSEAVIGLTIIAAGTSMPELATSAVGAFRGQSDISLGNVVGSNIFNILFVLGLAAVIHPIAGAGVRGIDQAFVLGTAVVLVPLMWTGRVIGRKEGALLLVSYAAYLWLMWPKG